MKLGTVRQWHWISSAACLVGMLLFSITGITLNHSADISSRPVVVSIEYTLEGAQLNDVQSLQGETIVLPASIRQWLLQQHGLFISPDKTGSLEDGEYSQTHASPGKDAWLAIDIETGELSYESVDRGWVAYFNDLHKGRYTGVEWRWFIDAFSVMCIIFCLSGLWLLIRQTRTRPSTWPWVGLGALIPAILIIIFVH